jgi:hypothetical protein
MMTIWRWALVLCCVGHAPGVQAGGGEERAVDGREKGSAWNAELAFETAGYVSPWNLGFADFTPQSPGSDGCLYDGPSEGSGGFVAGDSPGGVCCLVAPVHRPQGAEVAAVFFLIRDQSTDDVTLSLRRKRLSDTSSSTPLGTASSSSSGAGVRLFSDVTITNGVVDNDQYSYFVSTDTCLDQELDLRLYGSLVFFSE